MARSTNNPGCVGVIVFGMFVLVGTLATVGMINESRSGPTLQGWPTAPATIERSEVESDNGAFGPYSPAVVFEYSVDEKRYRSEQFAQHTVTDDDYTKVLRMLADYPVGGTATCFYDPADPSIAVLRGEPPLPMAMALFPLLFVVVGLIGLTAMVRTRRKNATLSRDPAARSLKKQSNVSGAAVGAVIFSILMMIGLILSLAWSKPTLEEMFSARSWIPADATIVDSRVRSHRGDKSTTYSVDAVYDYVVDGRTYRANRIDLIGGSSSGRESKQQRVNELRPGTKLTAYVDPTDPLNVVLDRSIGWTILLPLIPVFFLLIGFVGSTFSFRAWRRSRRSGDDEYGNPWAMRDPSHGRNSRDPQRVSSAVAMRDGPTAAGSVELKATSRALPFVFISIFALIWNGITWPMFLMSLGDDMCGTIFMIPFLLIGVGLGAAVLYTGLAMLNPRAALTLEPGTPRLGETLKMSFSLGGRTDRIEKLRITLEGIEQATYRRGTKSTTETSVFRRILLFETDQQFMMERGSVSAVLPVDTMPSLKAGSSEIKWQIKVHGSIRSWPDMSDTFAITVAPATIGARGAEWLR